jgi:DNA polymerase
MVLTKPPPKPPKFFGADKLLTPKLFDRPTQKLTHYSVPLAEDGSPAWADVLRRCGWPTDVVVIDFETFFDDEFHMSRGSGDGLSTIEYVQDARFEVLGCSFTLMRADAPGDNYITTTNFAHGDDVRLMLTMLQGRYGENLERCTVVIQNANFDALVLARRYGIHPPRVIDVLALSRHWHARSKHDLDTQAKRHDLIEKGDTAEFKGCTNRVRFFIPKSRKKGPKLPKQMPLMTGEQKQKLADYANNDAMREWELFTILLPKLSNPAVELQLIHHTLELWTKPTFRVDFAKAEELIGLMRAEVTKATADLYVQEFSAEAGEYVRRQITIEEISGNNSYEALLVDALKEAGDNPQKYFKPIKGGKYKLADAKDDAERELLLKHENERVRLLANARAAIKSWPIHIARVERIVRMAKADGGWLGVPLAYYGAHTGRWSGKEKINLQNLPKQGLLALIRNLLIAPEDYILVIVDAAAIEARVLAWLAGQWDLVDQFAAGAEIYCGFASKVLGWAVRKPKKRGGIPEIEKRMTWARNSIGKIGVLGCGYGMGTDKIFDMADGAIDRETADKIKVTYRTENKAIVQFWSDIEKAFIYTAKYRRSCALARGLRFDSAPDCDVVMTLPNGREIKYAKVRIEQGDYGNDTIRVYNATEHKWEYIWGGTLTENAVQAISRDVLAEAMLRVEARGHRVGIHVHDEIVPVVPKAIGEEVLKLSIEEMSRVPTWGERMPLGAEGCLSPCYKK